MKRVIIIFLAVLLIASIFPASAFAAETGDDLAIESLSFTDVHESNWFFPYVQIVHTHYVMQGTSPTTFSPGATFSRAQMVATLFRIYHGRAANEQDDSMNHFEDVAAFQWYAPYATWAHMHSISSGTSSTRFGANDYVARQEIAVMIHNYVRNLTGLDSSSTATAEWNAFTDRDQITSGAAYEAFRWANNHGIVNGIDGTRLAPNNTATRAEAAAMLVRLLYFLGEISTPIVPPQLPPTDPTRHTMTWRFSIYEEPSFMARRVATFGAQAVTVLEEGTDGWAQIATYRGNYWANIRQNRRFIENRTGLYAYRGAALPATSMHPQVVVILAQEDRWLQISTWQGAMWVNLDFTPPTQALDQLLGRFGNRVSVHFYNIETGFTYRYNATRTFASASVTKAPFAMYIFEKADRGETDLNSRIRYPFGGTLTQHEMIRRMLVDSSNAATFGLRDVHGTVGYRRWVANLGGNPNWVAHGIMGATLSADETAIFARAIFNYIESDAPHSDLFREHLLNNRFPFIVSDHPVASKTGWLNALLHDMAIVYADSPYILVILSDGINRATIREISMAFQHFNDTWF